MCYLKFFSLNLKKAVDQVDYSSQAIYTTIVSIKLLWDLGGHRNTDKAVVNYLLGLA